MAYQSGRFDSLNAGESDTQWFYDGDDSYSTLTASGYFADTVGVGDTVCVANSSGTFLFEFTSTGPNVCV